ncbi:TadE/TadG family type IV pilus assembly protein [Shewanella algae]|uniref:TadE/TadG family type IV pilus assembly protein n=1 Tax=Shewanella algae TaxID=38313 RepID=UPI001AACD4C8|nr:Tad domain-containing protein [Shewanella algae]QTE86621.1 Tad domain-containing protein [Shewanella algae]
MQVFYRYLLYRAAAKANLSRFPHRQAGYASVLFLAIFAAIGLAVFSLYDSGVVATERVRLQNTADNVAYSTATMVTRDMNVIAITNRAIVANQIAIGQVVALASWTNMIHEFTGNLETIGDWIQWIPYVGPIIEKLTEVMHKGTTVLRNAIKTGSGPFIFAQDQLITLLAGLQRVNHEATLASGINLYDEAIKLNDPDVQASPLVNAYNFTKFIQAYRGSTRYFERRQIRNDSATAQRFAEFGNVVNDSRDRMMANRGYKVGPRIPVPIGCDGPITGRIWAEKYGGTDFTLTKKKRGYQWSWTSLDTFSFWLKYRRGTFCHKTRTREFSPLGWGAAHALDQELRSDRYTYRDRRGVAEKAFPQNGEWKAVNYNRNNNRQAWANAWRNNNAANGVYRPTWHQGESKGDIDYNLRKTEGLRTFLDFKADTKTDIGPEFTVLLKKDESKMPTRKTLDDRNTKADRSDKYKVEEKGGMPGQQLFALASAVPIFSRPDEVKSRSNKPWMIKWSRQDKLREFGNLYNPFWQTRLKKSDDDVIKVLIGLGVIS